MSPLFLILLSAAGFVSASVFQQWRAGATDVIPARLRAYSGVGIVVGALWMAAKTPFWRHAFIVVSVMIFASMMVPNEMQFFVRHPSMILAVPFASGFVAANYRRSGVGALASCAVVAITILATYRVVEGDPFTGPWLHFWIDGVINPASAHGFIGQLH